MNRTAVLVAFAVLAALPVLLLFFLRRMPIEPQAKRSPGAQHATRDEPRAAEHPAGASSEGTDIRELAPVEPPRPAALWPDEGALELVGRIFDPYRRRVAGAKVSLARIDTATGGPKSIESHVTGERGSYVFVLREGGTFRVDVVAQSLEPAARGLTVKDARSLPPSFDFHLEAANTSRITGRILDSDGTPLTPAEMRFLFPRLRGANELGDRATDGRPDVLEDTAFPGNSGVFACHAQSLGQIFGQREAELDVATAALALDVPADFDGILYLLYRDIVLCRKPLRGHQTRADLVVDFAALRTSLCTLEVAVLDGQSGLAIVAPRVAEHGGSPAVAVAVSRHIDLVSNPLATHVWHDPPRLRLVDLPPGRYELLVSAAGFAPAHRILALADASKTREEVRLVQPAFVRVLVAADASGDTGDAPTSITLATPAGRPLPAAIRADEADGRPCFMVEEGPIGDVVVLVEGTVAARAQLVSGPNPDVTVSRRQQRTVACGIQLYRPPLGQRPDCCHAHVTLFDSEGTVIHDRVHGAIVQADGWAEVYDIRAAPGAYRLYLDFGAIRRATTDVTIPIEADVELTLPLD